MLPNTIDPTAELPMVTALLMSTMCLQKQSASKETCYPPNKSRKLSTKKAWLRKLKQSGTSLHGGYMLEQGVHQGPHHSFTEVSLHTGPGQSQHNIKAKHWDQPRTSDFLFDCVKTLLRSNLRGERLVWVHVALYGGEDMVEEAWDRWSYFFLSLDAERYKYWLWWLFWVDYIWN